MTRPSLLLGGRCTDTHTRILTRIFTPLRSLSPTLGLIPNPNLSSDFLPNLALSIHPETLARILMRQPASLSMNTLSQPRSAQRWSSLPPHCVWLTQ